MQQARLAQSVEHETLKLKKHLRVVGSSPTLGETFFLAKIVFLFINIWFNSLT